MPSGICVSEEDYIYVKRGKISFPVTVVEAGGGKNIKKNEILGTIWKAFSSAIHLEQLGIVTANEQSLCLLWALGRRKVTGSRYLGHCMA